MYYTPPSGPTRNPPDALDVSPTLDIGILELLVSSRAGSAQRIEKVLHARRLKEGAMSIPPMEQLDKEVKESSEKGHLCSQIVVDVGMQHLGMANTDVVRAMGGLVGAQGLMGATCGTLTAGACLIASANQGRVDRERIYMRIQELEERFNDELVSQYPSNHCDDILEADPTKLPTEICPPIIAGTIHIVLELLEDEGFEVH